MARGALIIVLLTAAATALAAAPAGERREPPARPDGLFVLSVITPNPARPGTGSRERVVVVDPRGGTTRTRALAGGTLCHGELLVVGDGLVFAGPLGRRAVSLGLDLRGRPRPVGRADLLARAERIPDRGASRRTPARAFPGASLGRYRALARSPGDRRLAGTARSPSGRWLVYADERERLMAHRARDRTTIELSARPGGTVLSIAAVDG